jgi:hypothetical protein
MVDFENSSSIDVVITWVDGNDPKHKAKLNSFLGGKNLDNISGADETRFGSINEIKYCVLSIIKFAPFVRNIFIVTDNQNPNIDDDIKKLYPERLKSIRVVDHKEIFEGYESFIPTFNSICIGNMVCRIKGLSDNFVLFNDDLFLIKDIKPEDWFKNGRPIMRGQWKKRPSVVLLKKKLLKYYRERVLKKNDANLKSVFKVTQFFGAQILGFKKQYFRTEHTPHPINKIKLEEYFKENESILKRNLKFKIRHYNQFNTVSLANHLEIRSGNTNQITDNVEFVYLNPYGKYFNYVNKKLAICNNENKKFMCAQSLDIATESDKDKVIGWLEKLLTKNE